MTDTGERRRVVLRHTKRGLRGDRAVDEKPYRLVFRKRRRRDHSRQPWTRQRGHRVGSLSRDPERLAARRQNFDLRAALEQLRCKLGARLDQMFAVVENDEEPSTADVLEKCLRHRAPRFLLDAEYRRHRLRHETRIGERSELDEPHAIGEVVHDFGSNLQREARLADAAGAVQQYQPVLRQESRHLG